MSSSPPDTAPVPTTLGSLSTEILFLICKELCCHCYDHRFRRWPKGDDLEGSDGLRSLCLMSRRLRSVAQPFLYHRPPQQVPIAPFVRTIMARPDLAEEVKEWSNGGDLWTPFGGWGTEAWFQQVVAVAKGLELGSDTDPNFSKTLTHTFEPVRLLNEMAIAMFPSLISLTIMMNCHDGTDENTTLDYLLNRLRRMGPRAFLKRVKTLTFESSDGNGFSLISPGVSTMVMSTPNIKRLAFGGLSTCTKGRFDRRPGSVYALSHSLRGVKKVLFRWSYVADDDGGKNFRALQSFFMYCHQLEYFLFETTEKLRKEPDAHHLSPSRLLSALLPRMDTLKHLTLDLSSSCIHSGYLSAESTLVTGGSLERFSKLETLHLDEKSYCRHWFQTDRDGYPPEITTCLSQVVGPNIKAVIVKMEHFSETLTMRDILHFGKMVKKGRYPNLRKLHLLIFTKSRRLEEIWALGRVFPAEFIELRECFEEVEAELILEGPAPPYQHGLDHDEIFNDE